MYWKTKIFMWLTLLLWSGMEPTVSLKYAILDLTRLTFSWQLLKLGDGSIKFHYVILSTFLCLNFPIIQKLFLKNTNSENAPGQVLSQNSNRKLLCFINFLEHQKRWKASELLGDKYNSNIRSRQGYSIKKENSRLISFLNILVKVTYSERTYTYKSSKLNMAMY